MTNKKLKISIISLLYLSFISLPSFGQLFDSEQNPLSVKWQQINTNGFRIIYPTELAKDAQRMANTITKIYHQIGAGLNRQKTTLPIVFQNRGTTANGFVQLAPKKSQFYTTPPQQFDSQDWLNNLAVHELRHVAQFDKITGREKFFLTEELHFAYLGASIPTWFFEGDAVGIETALTSAGRGRQPAWIMPFRTALLSGQKLSYSKAYFGSNKQLTVGYYQLGYLMTSNLRTSYGKNAIDSLLLAINKRPLRLSPFSKSFRKITGFKTKAYYKQTLAKLDTEWRAQDRLNESKSYPQLNLPSTYVTNYYLPTEVANKQVLVLKQSKSQALGFVLINPDKIETQLFKIGYQEQPWFSYGNGKLVWDEIRFDPRYKQRSYSVICSYDFATKSKRQLTFETRLFSPAISGDGKKLLAVQIDLSNQSTLVEVDLSTGAATTILPNPENLILQTPALAANGDQMAWITVSEKGKALWIRDQNGITTKLIAETNQQLNRPVFINNQIAFNAHYSGVDNIYRISVDSKKISALTASKYGAFNASSSNDGKSILFNDFNKNGYQVAQTDLVATQPQENHFVYVGKAAEIQENTGNIFSTIPDRTYEVKSYRPISHLFNFHSISFSVNDDDQLGLQLKSNDLLNTMDVFGGVDYNGELRKFAYRAGFTYKSLYPVLSATIENRPRTGFYEKGASVYQANWRENHLNLKAALPLSISVYNHNYSLLAEVGTSYTQRNFGPQEATLFRKSIAFPMRYQIGIGHSIRTAERDVAPKWAQSISISYFNQPFEKNLSGELIAFESAFYFPGIARNHSLMASFNYQESSGVLNFNNEISTVYGYGQILAKSQLRNTLLLNYRFPFAFPDAEIGGLAYIRNLRGGFFSHYENIGSETNLTQPKTFGLELRSSINLLRYQPVVDLGARLVFVNKIYHQNPILEFIFNYSF
jgi:hypothetical protein